MTQLFRNNVSGVLASGINASQTSITLVDASGFPSPTGGEFFLATLIGLNGNGQESSWEVVRCTARASNTLTVVRGQEGTSGASWAAATTIQMRVTAGTVYPVASGGTGATDAATARTNLGALGAAGDTMNGDLIVNGRVGIGLGAVTADALRVVRNIDGGTNSNGVLADGTVQSGVTARASYFRTVSNTQAATFTLSSLLHYEAAQNASFGAGSTVTTQVGFRADSTLVGATTNIGFRGSIPTGANRWNLYMDGTADNYLNGRLSIGTTAPGNSGVKLSLPLTGGTTRNGYEVDATINSDVTADVRAFATNLSTQAATFTLSNLNHFHAIQSSLGGGSTVTNQTGFLAGTTLVGATNNYGFRGAIPAAANRWNLFMDGTASNFLGGNLIVNAPVGFGASSSPSYGTSGQFLKSAGNAAAPTWGSLTSGEVTTALGFTPVNPGTSQTANTFYAAPNGSAGAPTFRAIAAADIPTLNQSTTGTASNVTGTVAVANGGTGASTAPNARTNLGGTTVGQNVFTLTNPSAITFLRVNADNTVSALDAATFRGAIGAGAGDVTTSGTQTLTNKTISGGIFSGVIDDTGSVRGGITAVAALDINCSLGNFFTKTINANSTFTVSSVPASRAYAFTLELTHTSGTVTWFAGVQWPGGTAPTLTTGKVHLFTFVTDDGGTTWRGASQVNYNS